MTSLRLDSDRQQISIALDLHGEQTPIELTIRYQVLAPNRIEITEVDSSRRWIATLVNEMIPDDQKCIEVPSVITTALSKLIR